MSFIKGINRNQAQIFPEYLEDYVDEENPVRVIDAFINSLDIKKYNFTKNNPDKPGAPSYDPKDMLKLYIYGYINAVRSSRKLEKSTYNNIEVMWLIKKLHPDFKTIADFRKENKKQLKNILKEFNLLCKDWGLFSGKMIAVDGTKFRADNSKRNNYSKKKIDRQLSYIEKSIEKYMNEMDKGDKEPEIETKYTKDELKEKIKKLKERKTFYEDLNEELKTSGENEISTTDPDARMMDNKKNGVEVNYNVQIAVDDKNNLVLAVEVTNNPSDHGHLNDMVQASKEVLGMEEKDSIEVVADKGYYQTEDLKKCEKNNTITYVPHQIYQNTTKNPEYYIDKFKYIPEEDIYICPQGQKLYRTKHKGKVPERIKYKNYEACKKCINKDLCTTSKNGRLVNRSKDKAILDRVDKRTEQNIEKYLRRQMIVEHPFGTVKRTMNAGYFLTRRLDSVKTEASLVFLAYNIKRVINILGVKEIIRRLEAKSSRIFYKLKKIHIFSLKSTLNVNF